MCTLPIIVRINSITIIWYYICSNILGVICLFYCSFIHWLHNIGELLQHLVIHHTHLSDLVKVLDIIWNNIFKFILKHHTLSSMETTHVLCIVIIFFSHHLDDIFHDNQSYSSNWYIFIARSWMKVFSNLRLFFILFFDTRFYLLTQSLNLFISESFFFNDIWPFFTTK